MEQSKDIILQEPTIFDTTLREGFQTPGGIGASLEERIYIASLIQRYADWVELGMPANNVDYDVISAIRDRFLQEKYPAGIAVLARCNQLDIERSAKVMKDYPNNMIHLFVGVSEEHRKNRFEKPKTPEEYKQDIKNNVEMAASSSTFLRVMYSPEDAYRAFRNDNELFIEFIGSAKEGYDAGNRVVGRKPPLVINLPDTVGCSTVNEFGELVAKVKKAFGNSIELSVHCHNDSFEADSQVLNVYQMFGGKWIFQGTFGRLGERNGIASTDLMIKKFAERGYFKDSRIVHEENLRELDPITKAILWSLGRDAPQEHLYRNNISTSGIHTDIVRKDIKTYHFNGEKYGSGVEIELGPTSGTKQVINILEKYDIRYDKNRLESFTDNLKKISNERKAPISLTEILYEASIEFNGNDKNDGINVTKCEVATDVLSGKTKLNMQGHIDNKCFDEYHIHNGPVEAAMELLNRVINNHRGCNTEIKLESYNSRIIHIIGKEYTNWEIGSKPKIPKEIGKNAHQAISLIFKNGDGERYHGWARHENSTSSEILSVIDGMSKMYALQKWGVYKKAT